MNAEPHIHRVEIAETSRAFHVDYGDQNARIFKAWRWPFESERHYAQRMTGRVKRLVRKVVRKHDQQSIMAHTIKQMAVPTLDPGKWGSEQLG